MKKIVVVLLCLLFAKAASAQKDSLSFDEHNKYIYYKVVEQPGLTADTFQNRALYFLKINYPKNKIAQASPATITGSGKFLILTGLSVAKHVAGEVSYTFTIGYKDQKYRYWLTDFVYTPYKTDRYGNSVPEQGVEISLESGLSKLEKVELNNCLEQSGAYGIQFGGKLKEYMLRPSATKPVETKKKVISTKDW
jgi:Domain of unknown function (DUF4468) with TBP-like fold